MPNFVGKWARFGNQLKKDLVNNGSIWIVGPVTSMSALKDRWLLDIVGFIPKIKFGINIDDNLNGSRGKVMESSANQAYF